MLRYFSQACSLMLIFAVLVLPLGSARAATANWWLKGVTVLPSSSTDFSSSNFQQSMRNFKALGGTYVNFAIPYYQSNPYSTDIGPGYNTPSDASLAAGIQFVHSLGLHAQISVYLENWSGDWRATINPSDRNTWYANYNNVLMHYAALAQQQQVELFELGAELIDMSSAAVNGDNTQRWDAMINNVRGVYSGALTYSANRGQQGWMSELPNIGFWDKLDYVGVSAYYELPGDGSVGSLESDWQNINNYDIGPIHQKTGKPVIFTEVGYESISGAHTQPWNSGMGGSYDAQEQVNDYQALLEYWSSYDYMQGVDLWWWSPNPNYGGSGNTDYTPQNKPASQTLATWWQGGGAVSGTPHMSASGSANPSAPAVNQSVTLGASVTDSGSATNNAIVDLEVYSGSSKVFQQVFTGQMFSTGQTKSYTAQWTPTAAGTYTLKIGVFSGDWSQAYMWNNAAATITVGGIGATSGGGSTTGTQALDIWWPTDGSHVTGVQPFKAMLENTDVSQYTMYWQVDGGSWVPMSNSSQTWPHKEALVDVSGWSWHGAGPYTVNFVATNSSGSILQQKSVKIYTQ